jgi:hypothetical protein
MASSSTGRWLHPLLCTSLAILVLACPKKPPPAVEDAAPPPPPAPTPSVTELAPIGEDAGDDAAAEAAAPKKWTGPAYNGNQLRIKECCNAMRAQAKQMGPSSPEGFQLNALATQCDLVAAQVGPQGTAPEFNQLRQMLKSIKLPVACQL